MFNRIFGGKNKQKETSNETLKSLRNRVQGYHGYEDVNDRKPTDEAIRKYFYDRVLELLDEYSKVQNHLMQGQLLSTWSPSNAIMNMLNELRTLLMTDVYRHSTFFETPDVSDSLDISVIYVLESETIITMQQIKKQIINIREKLEELDLMNIESEIYNIKESIEEVKTTISDRAELIASFELVGI